MSVTNVPLTITGLLDNLCFEGTFPEAIKEVLSKVVVQVPNTVTNVVVGPDEPSDSQRDFVWFKRNSAGDFEGIFIYVGGDWQQIFPVLNSLTWVYGDSDSPPPGYVAANDAASPLTAPEKTHLETLWYPPGPGGPWSIYQAVYVGF